MAETIKITTDLIIIHREGGDESYGRNGEAIQDTNSNELAWIPDTASAAELRLGVMVAYDGPQTSARQELDKLGSVAPKTSIDVFTSTLATSGLQVDAPRMGVMGDPTDRNKMLYTA